MASNAQERASLKTSLSLWHSGDKVGYSWIQHYLYSEHRSWEKDGKGMLPWIRESLLAAITIDMHRLWVCLERGFHGIFVPAAPVASCFWGLCRHFWCDEYHHQDTDWRWWPPALHNLEKNAGRLLLVDESNGCSKFSAGGGSGSSTNVVRWPGSPLHLSHGKVRRIFGQEGPRIH